MRGWLQTQACNWNRGLRKFVSLCFGAGHCGALYREVGPWGHPRPKQGQGFNRLGVLFSGVPRIKIIVYQGLHWCHPIYADCHKTKHHKQLQTALSNIKGRPLEGLLSSICNQSDCHSHQCLRNPIMHPKDRYVYILCNPRIPWHRSRRWRQIPSWQPCSRTQVEKPPNCFFFGVVYHRGVEV